MDQAYNKSLIDTLLFRCFSISSDYTSFHLEVGNLREILKKNSYPSGIIEQYIRSFLIKLHITRKVIPTVPKKELFIVLPYPGKLSSNLKRKLTTCLKNSLPQRNIKIILQSTNRLSSLFCFKDVIPKELLSQFVYKFLCGNCNVTYDGKTERHLNLRSSEHIGIGKTERHLNLRSSEHIGISHLTGKKVECKPSAVSDYLLLHNHDSDFYDFTILCRDNNGFRLLIKESILISRDSPVLNKNTASIPLLLFD